MLGLHDHKMKLSWNITTVIFKDINVFRSYIFNGFYFTLLITAQTSTYLKFHFACCLSKSFLGQHSHCTPIVVAIPTQHSIP